MPKAQVAQIEPVLETRGAHDRRSDVSSAAEFAGLVILGTGAAGALVYWAIVCYHVVRTILTIPTARAGLALPQVGDGAGGERALRICTIVPAHNEEACIANIAASLAQQDYPHQACVFVLDRCTDGTRAALERAWAAAASPATRAPLEIIELSDCPEGWVGKSHAVWMGATASSGARDADLLLFVDADTTLDPGLVRAAVALLKHRGVGMLSLMSSLTHDRWFEQLVQPAAAMELVRQYPIARANARTRRRAFANGQFILINAAEYRRIGGHEAIRAHVLEDVELARKCEQHGVAAALLLSGGMLRCRMYDSYSAFHRGWRRILGEAANRKSDRLRRNAWRVWWTATILPAMACAAAIVGWWRLGGPHPVVAGVTQVLGGLGTAVCLATWVVVYITGRIPVWAAPAFPVGSWLIGGIMRAAARDLDERRPTEWGGRAYVRDAR